MKLYNKCISDQNNTLCLMTNLCDKKRSSLWWSISWFCMLRDHVSTSNVQGQWKWKILFKLKLCMFCIWALAYVWMAGVVALWCIYLLHRSVEKYRKILRIERAGTGRLLAPAIQFILALDIIFNDREKVEHGQVLAPTHMSEIAWDVICTGTSATRQDKHKDKYKDCAHWIEGDIEL